LNLGSCVANFFVKEDMLPLSCRMLVWQVPTQVDTSCAQAEKAGHCSSTIHTIIIIIQRDKFMINALMELPSDVASNLGAAD